MMVVQGCLDGLSVQVVWEKSILYDVFFFYYFIDMHPGVGDEWVGQMPPWLVL